MLRSCCYIRTSCCHSFNTSSSVKFLLATTSAAALCSHRIKYLTRINRMHYFVYLSIQPSVTDTIDRRSVRPTHAPQVPYNPSILNSFATSLQSSLKCSSKNCKILNVKSHYSWLYWFLYFKRRMQFAARPCRKYYSASYLPHVSNFYFRQPIIAV